MPGFSQNCPDWKCENETYFNLVHLDEVESTGHPVADRGHAIAVAQRLAIDIAENRQDCLGRPVVPSTAAIPRAGCGYSIPTPRSIATSFHPRENIRSEAIRLN